MEQSKTSILDRIKKQTDIMYGLPNTTILEENIKSALSELQKYEEKKYKEKILFVNPFKDKRYVIECKKCGFIFDYGYEDLKVESCKDRYGNIIKTKDRFVECPKCGRDYDFGYENQK